MAEFELTASSMNEAASNIKNYSEQFKEYADQAYQAAESLSGEWQGDAPQSFVERMNEFHKWLVEMSGIIDTYSASLNQAAETYQEADTRSSSAFGR